MYLELAFQALERLAVGEATLFSHRTIVFNVERSVTAAS